MSHKLSSVLLFIGLIYVTSVDLAISSDEEFGRSVCDLRDGFASIDGRYRSPDLVETDRLTLKRVNSASEDVRGFTAIFSDYKREKGWPTKRMKEAEAYAQADQKEQFNVYNLISFSDYNAYQKADNRLIGRFNFARDLPDDRIETTIYLISEFRGKGYGPELIAGIIRHVVEPGIGKSYLVEKQDPDEITDSVSDQEAFWCIFGYRPSFVGIIARCHLANHFVDNDYGSIAAHYKGGCGIIYDSYADLVSMTYPPGEPLKEQEVISLINISRVFRDCLAIKMNKLDYDPSWDKSIQVREIVHSPEYEQFRSVLQREYLKLLETTEPQTFIKVFQVLATEFLVGREELSSLIGSDKASRIISFFSSTDEPPYGLELLQNLNKTANMDSQDAEGPARCKQQYHALSESSAGSLTSKKQKIREGDE